MKDRRKIYPKRQKTIFLQNGQFWGADRPLFGLAGTRQYFSIKAHIEGTVSLFNKNCKSFKSIKCDVEFGGSAIMRYCPNPLVVTGFLLFVLT